MPTAAALLGAGLACCALLTGCSESDSLQDVPSTPPVDPLITAAGSNEAIEGAAREALRFCHSETKYKDQSIASTYTPNEFQGVYIEDDGNTLRHVIVGTARMPEGSDGTVVGGYACTYLQFAKNGNPPAKDPQLNVVMENNFAPLGEGGDSWEKVSDELRQANGGEKFVIYPGTFAQATAGLSIDVADAEDGQAAAPSRTSNGRDSTTKSDSQFAKYPSGDAVLPGYPMKVDINSLDSRVSSWIQRSAPNGQAVAVAPGVYAPYSPIEPNLDKYLDGPVDGDCMVREKFFPNTGGSCWSGVQPGAQEPPL